MRGASISSFMNPAKILLPYEEVQGSLTDLEEDSGDLLAVIGRMRIWLPIEMKTKLEPLLEYRIAIIRTDLAPQDYRCRLIEGTD